MTITLDRPDQLNAFNWTQQRELAAALKQARAPEVRAVIITGAGRGFCVGQDLGEALEEGGGNDVRLRDGYNPNITAIRTLEKPVIAAINGVAAGAGLSLALACDVRIASRKAKLVPAFANIGLVPDAGCTYFATRLLGYSRAFEWLASGRHLSADEAHAMGLVSDVLGPDALLDRATEMAGRFASMTGVGVGLTKRLMQNALGATLEQQLNHELELQTYATSTPEYHEAIAAFMSKA
jgi:2-(1,2-epoxy-1,2-dihydrophenyl)acetyl-CoA isomerase